MTLSLRPRGCRHCGETVPAFEIHCPACGHLNDYEDAGPPWGLFVTSAAMVAIGLVFKEDVPAWVYDLLRAINGY